MAKAFLLAALVFVVSAHPISAQDTKVSVGMTGIGGMSCAHWRATKEHESEGTVWIFGFWTGLNYVAAASEQPQSGADSAEIVAKVKKRCAEAPSQSLASAVWTTYLEFKKRQGPTFNLDHSHHFAPARFLVSPMNEPHDQP
jgi:hypothetical protein